MRRAYRQCSLIEVLLPDADKLWDPTLRRIDALLDDEGLVDRVAEASGRSSCRSSRARSARAWANRAPPGAVDAEVCSLRPERFCISVEWLLAHPRILDSPVVRAVPSPDYS